MTFCFLRGPLRCEGEKAPILLSLIDVAETPKDIFDIAGRVMSETAVIVNYRYKWNITFLKEHNLIT